MDWVALLARISLIVIFLVSGLSKLADRKGWQQVLAAYPIPKQLVLPLVVLLALVELATVGLLVLSASARWGPIAALALLGLFTATLRVTLRSTGRAMVRNGLLAAGGAIVLWRGGATPNIASAVAAASFTPAAWIGLAVALSALALGLIEAWFIFKVLPQQGRILMEIEKLQRAVRVAPDVIFHPTNRNTVEALLRLANVTAADTVYDLGCGDGRIVI